MNIVLCDHIHYLIKRRDNQSNRNESMMFFSFCLMIMGMSRSHRSSQADCCVYLWWIYLLHNYRHGMPHFWFFLVCWAEISPISRSIEHFSSIGRCIHWLLSHRVRLTVGPDSFSILRPRVLSRTSVKLGFDWLIDWCLLSHPLTLTDQVIVGWFSKQNWSNTTPLLIHPCSNLSCRNAG